MTDPTPLEKLLEQFQRDVRVTMWESAGDTNRFYVYLKEFAELVYAEGVKAENERVLAAAPKEVGEGGFTSDYSHGLQDGHNACRSELLQKITKTT